MKAAVCGGLVPLSRAAGFAYVRDALDAATVPRSMERGDHRYARWVAVALTGAVKAKKKTPREDTPRGITHGGRLRRGGSAARLTAGDEVVLFRGPTWQQGFLGREPGDLPAWYVLPKEPSFHRSFLPGRMRNSPRPVGRVPEPSIVTSEIEIQIPPPPTAFVVTSLAALLQPCRLATSCGRHAPAQGRNRLDSRRAASAGSSASVRAV